MRLFAHLDPHTLEGELLRRIAAAKEADPFAPVLVIVPSRRLSDHLARRIGERLGAALGIEIAFHRALAARILESAGASRPAPAGPLLLEALLDEVLRGFGERNALAAFVRSRAGAASGLLDTLVEFREAGATSAEVAAAAASERDRDVAAIYAAYVARLASLRGRGLADDATRAVEAMPHAAAYAERFTRVFHHGAYELVGVNLDLVRALDEGRVVEFLIPVAPGRAVSSYAEEFAQRFLLPSGGTLEPLEAPYASCLGARLAALYDEGARPDPLPAERWALASTQGVSTELTWALRQAVAGAIAGTPVHETALIARTWSPYAAPVADTLQEGAIPCDIDRAVLPLRREPLVADTIAALRAAADDFPRAATAELLRSPRICWDGLAPAAAPVPGELAEGWSREAGIVSGLSAWTEDLPAWAGVVRTRDEAGDAERERRTRQANERGDAARRLGAAVSALATRIAPGERRGWSAHADAAADLAGRLYDDPRRSTKALRLLAPALDAARDRERLLGDGAPVPFPAFVAWLERAADVLPAPVRSRSGAIAVVDAMQGRGTTFSRVHLVGLQSGILPRIPREDAYASDPFRLRLRESTGRPVSIKLDADREERLLLALVLGAARDRLDLSWPRADEDGRAKVPSPALREIARVLLGEPDAEALRRKAFAVPSHPRARLEAFAERTGLLSRAEEAALVALQAEGRDEGRAELAARDPGLGPRLDLMAATESFAPDDLRFDARVAPSPERPWSVTALETLGRCALQFFFREVLRVRPLVEEPSPFSASAREIGERVHALLESVYAKLVAEGAFENADPERLAARGAALVESQWESAIGSSSRRIARTLPMLHGIETESWKGAVRRFVVEDLEALAREGAVPDELEKFLEGRVDAGEGVAAQVRGRFDRIARTGTGKIVADYKTSGDLGKRVETNAILRGERLQVPLYRDLANGAPVELLGVGPSYDGAADEAAVRRVRFDGFDDPKRGALQEAGFRETLRVLLRLPAGGVYPIRPGRHCSFCEWRAACRHDHPPTVERQGSARDGADYRALEKKTKTKPLIADVAGDPDEGEDA